MQYTISQILEIVKAWFSEIFWEFSFLCVAEIVWCKYWKKAVFIECIEYDQLWNVKAKCTVCVFNKALLEDFFIKTWLTKDTIVWHKILFNWHVSLYEDRVNIILDTLSTSYTLWQLQQSQHAIIDTLTKEWVIKNNKNTDIWFPPYNMAIISSHSSDGLQDFLTVLDEQSIPYTYTLYETTVHGNTAKESVHKSLQAIYTDYKKWVEYNAICIIRWGWDTAGILWQNDIDIARWICHMPIPVIVAVWHTKDTTILDEVSFYTANTPTAAAQLLVDYTNEYANEITQLLWSINTTIRTSLHRYDIHITSLYDRIHGLVEKNYENLSKKINELWNVIQIYHPNNILEKGYAIIRQETAVIHDSIPLLWEEIDIETSHLIIKATVESVATKE